MRKLHRVCLQDVLAVRSTDFYKTFHAISFFAIYLAFVWFATLIPASASHAAATWEDISSQVTINTSNPIRSRRATSAKVIIEVTNNGSSAITGPMRLVLGDLLPATVSLQGANGSTDGGDPYLDLTPDSLAPGATTGQITLVILDVGSATFNFYPRVERQPPVVSDDDADGVPNSTDQCPNTPAGEAVGGNGCSSSQKDDDGDNIFNSTDQCPNTPVGEAIDVNGCSDSQKDDDGDGLSNSADQCANTPTGEAADGSGCSNSQKDDDGDNVFNNTDQCPSTPAGEAVDGSGCSNSQKDDDGDNVPNSTDQCANTPAGETADSNGCSDSQKDGDGDGVPNSTDQCSSTPSGETVDASGCSNNQKDDDADNVANGSDQCPSTPSGEAVDGSGCSDSQKDDDADTVANSSDQCPATPSGETIDANGCSDSQKDDDNDTVPNSIDQCPNTSTGEAADANGCSNSQKLTVIITSPETLITVGSSPIDVSGTISQPDSTLMLNGVPVAHSNGLFSASVSLEEGHNTIIARAVGAQGAEVTDSIVVSMDMTPPYITVENPADGQTVNISSIAVSGLVNDIVRGTVSEGQANVLVNGIQASVSNRSYLAENVPLQEGDNLIEISAADQVGNTASISINVRYELPDPKRIELQSGQNQSAKIRTALPDPLAVKLIGNDGEPVPNTNVVFRVIQGDGNVGAGSDIEAQGIVVVTDENGISQTRFKLGSRAGSGNHRVRAKAVGFDGEVVFYATAETNPGDKVSVNSGNNQRGAINQPLPHPFVIAVTDEGANVVEGASVEFKVTQGGGKFQNDATTYTAQTDSDGRATAHLRLGATVGFDVHRVTATLVDTELSAGFTASGLVSGDAGNTRISGIVMDNQDTPLPGVTIRVDGTTRQAVTDDAGQFLITNVPVGPVHLLADGSTTTVEGEWPTLSYNIVTVAGAENPLPAPIYMVKLDTENAVRVGAEDAVLTLPEVPGFKLEVKAGSVTFPDGSNEGLLSVTPVNSSKVPMAPPNGMQPQFIVTIQPAGTKFDPPAPLTLPNVDGHLPGAQVEMYSYDHDLEEFVAIGLGTVSADGSVVKTNNGVGVIKAGWHCGSQPTGSGCCSGGAPPKCDACEKLSSGCNASCVPDPSKQAPQQIAEDCKEKLCDGTTKFFNDPKKDLDLLDCKVPICDSSTKTHGFSRSDSQVPDNEIISECKLKKYSCTGSGNNISQKDEVEEHTGEPLKGDKVCYACDAGVLDKKDLKIGLEFSKEISAPAKLSTGVTKFLTNFGTPDASWSITATGKYDDCCENEKKGIAYSVTGDIGGSVNVTERVFPCTGCPDPKVSVSIWTPVYSFSASLELEGGVYATGSVAFKGELKAEDNTCKSNALCITGGGNVTGKIGLDARAGFAACAKQDAPGDRYDFDVCHAERVYVEGSASVEGKCEASTCTASGCDLCFKGFAAEVGAFVAVKKDGVETKEKVAIKFGPVFGNCK